MTFKTLNSTKKIFYYTFFPTKEEEESSKTRPAPGRRRQIIEIWDDFRPPSGGSWPINKTLTKLEIESGKLVLSCNDMFEYVLRYWPVELAKSIVSEGQRVYVAVCDATQELKYPRKYGMDQAYVEMVKKDNFALVCMTLVKDRNLKIYDEISLKWDDKRLCFMFKLLLL
ncbi:arginine biosynthesis bifunctional protein ArgJ [Striga asiatica]|uniref:Arginine biosynthesis bifunctional protein ArgJ n=1 Tax=Striga asiatica TaxID=4170 RepID=A0A5A7QSF3_STRAF|nr:arginine biosynthesis bifunctional protein ArgJ [Striga asiatica]